MKLWLRGPLGREAGAAPRRTQLVPTSASWFQSASTAPPQDTSYLASQVGDASGNTCLRNGRKHWTGRGGGNKKWMRTRRRNTKSEKEEEELHGRAGIHRSCGEPVLEQGKRGEEGAAPRNCRVLTIFILIV